MFGNAGYSWSFLLLIEFKIVYKLMLNHCNDEKRKVNMSKSFRHIINRGFSEGMSVLIDELFGVYAFFYIQY